MKLDANKVRWHRDSRGWTLETTAEQAEVALGTVLRAEHGEDIRPSSGRRIARAFDIDISELVPDRPGATVPKGEAPSTSGPPRTDTPPKASKERLEEERHGAFPIDYRGCADSLEKYSDRWAQKLADGDLEKPAVQEFFVATARWFPILQAALTAELADIARTKGTGDVQRNSELLQESYIMRAADRYLSLASDLGKAAAEKFPDEDLKTPHLQVIQGWRSA